MSDINLLNSMCEQLISGSQEHGCVLVDMKFLVDRDSLVGLEDHEAKRLILEEALDWAEQDSNF